MALLAIAAVLTLVVGPAFDHHFAERQASHGHLFLNDVPFEHGHMVDADHEHGDAVSVVATGDNDASGVAIDNLVPPSAARPVDGDDTLQLAGIVGDDDARPGPTTAPPVRPPIA